MISFDKLTQKHTLDYMKKASLLPLQTVFVNAHIN